LVNVYRPPSLGPLPPPVEPDIFLRIETTSNVSRPASPEPPPVTRLTAIAEAVTLSLRSCVRGLSVAVEWLAREEMRDLPQP
jgi:hypothetical protein